MPGPSSGCGTMSGTSIKMEKSEESIGGGGKGWGGGGRDRDSSSDGGGGGSGENTGLDPQLWHACAGGMVQLPPVGAKVIYFPQGHGEQAATPPEFPRVMGTGSTGTIPCRVMSVNFLADTETDEVYARMRLQTLPPEPTQSHSDSSMDAEAGPASPPPEKTNSFAKTLTQSDANNGGGFSVPRYCAETIFPPLDYSIDPPVQTIVAKDVHGEKWRFRHIYRGTPRRHLLTTGWSTFVNQKKLVAGDAIVFLRSASGELCVGVRRSMRGTGGSDSSNWSGGGSSTSHHRPNRWEVKGNDVYSDFFNGDAAAGTASAGGNGVTRGPGSLGSGPGIVMCGPSTSSSFARNRARVTAQSVLDAASLALRGQPFEVVYYPRASTAEFCVKEQSVKTALEQHWYPGMRFKMAFETEDSSRISWFMGTINSVQPCDPHWPKSPWRVLQVNWDEPDLLQGVSRVSPWQVELVSTLPIQFPTFASMPKKKPRAAPPTELNLPGQGLMGIPMATVPPVFGPSNHHPNPWAHGVIVEDVSAGMQGARHERVIGLALTEPFRPSKIQAGYFPSDSFYHADTPGKNNGQMAHSPSPLQNANAYPPLQGRENSLSHSNIVAGNPRGRSPQDDHRHGPSSWAGLTTSTNNKTTPSSTPLILFGQAINPDSNFSHVQHSGGSTSDGLSSLQHLKEESPGKGQEHHSPSLLGRKEMPLDSAGRIETAERVHQKYYPPSSGYHPNGKIQDFSGMGTATSITATDTTPKWAFGGASLEKDRRTGGGDRQGPPPPHHHHHVSSATRESFSHCKVFRESDEVGRTVDLCQFSSYDELYEKLGAMFSMDEKPLGNAMVYRDAGSRTKEVGYEPYRVFAMSARRVTILTDQSGRKMRA